VKVSEQISMEKCDQEVMDFLAATDVGKFPPITSGGASAGVQPAEEKGPADSPLFHPFSFVLYICHFWMLSFVKKGTKGSRSGAPLSSRPARRRRGLRGCHTLSRVNTV